MRHHPTNNREYETFYGDPGILAPAGWRRVEQEEALAQPPHIDVMYVDRDQAGPSFWVVREKSHYELGGTVTVAPQLGSTRVGTWFSALEARDRKTVLVLLHELRTLCEKRTEGARESTRQLDLVLGLLRALDADHQALKPENQSKPPEAS
jgi:hypothetical protein